MEAEKNNDSILNSVKSMLGIPTEVKDFDVSIITNINSAFIILWQLGVGPSNPFTITGEEETYEDFVSNPDKYKMVNMYLYLKTKLGFDPPTSATLMDNYNKQINELEFRMMIQDDPKDTFKK